MLHTEEFALGVRATFRNVDFVPTVETTDEQYPFLLNTGRSLYQFNAGTMTQRTPNTVLYPEDVLDICPEDAHRLKIISGQRIRLRSRWGQTELPIRINENVKPGEVFATFHTPRAALNRVTSSYRDHQVHTPEYKVTAVRIEELG